MIKNKIMCVKYHTPVGLFKLAGWERKPSKAEEPFLVIDRSGGSKTT